MVQKGHQLGVCSGSGKKLDFTKRKKVKRD